MEAQRVHTARYLPPSAREGLAGSETADNALQVMHLSGERCRDRVCACGGAFAENEWSTTTPQRDADRNLIVMHRGQQNHFPLGRQITCERLRPRDEAAVRRVIAL